MTSLFSGCLWLNLGADAGSRRPRVESQEAGQGSGRSLPSKESKRRSSTMFTARPLAVWGRVRISHRIFCNILHEGNVWMSFFLFENTFWLLFRPLTLSQNMDKKQNKSFTHGDRSPTSERTSRIIDPWNKLGELEWTGPSRMDEN